MNYGRLVNGVFEEAPRNFTTPSGATITNFNFNEVTMRMYGFKNVIDTRPVHDEKTQHLRVKEYKETESSIDICYEVVDIPYVEPTPSIEERVISLEKMDVDLIATSWDMDFRIMELEWFLEDSMVASLNINLKNTLRKGERNMALSRFEQAKIMILGGSYNRETLERQLKTYKDRGVITKDEYDTLISMMDAKELVTEQI